MVGLAPKWVRLAPNGSNPGLFQIRFQCIWRGGAKCTEIWSEKAPDLSHLGSNLTHFGAKLTITESNIICRLALNSESSIEDVIDPTLNTHTLWDTCTSSCALKWHQEEKCWQNGKINIPLSSLLFTIWPYHCHWRLRLRRLQILW